MRAFSKILMVCAMVLFAVGCGSKEVRIKPQEDLTPEQQAMQEQMQEQMRQQMEMMQNMLQQQSQQLQGQMPTQAPEQS